jgi:hypothetical protein
MDTEQQLCRARQHPCRCSCYCNRAGERRITPSDELFGLASSFVKGVSRDWQKLQYASDTGFVDQTSTSSQTLALLLQTLGSRSKIQRLKKGSGLSGRSCNSRCNTL